MTSDNGTFSDITSRNSSLNVEVHLTTTITDTSGDIQLLIDAAKGFASQAKAPSTRRAYQSDWRAFTSWCRLSGFSELPTRPEVVAMYITHLASSGRKVATINRALVSISQAHKMGGYPSPTSAAQVLETLKGIRRTLGTRQRQKAALETADLRVMVAELGDNLLGLRDRALLLVGFAGALRRSELIGLNLDNIEFAADGLVITLERSKTDQEGRGRRIGVPHGGSPLTCPVRALRAWLTAANIVEGPVFRRVGRWGRVGEHRLNDRAVARVVQRCASAVGLDPCLYAGHSLRSGFATCAARAGKSERSIMDQTGHRSVAMVRRYIRSGTLFVDNAASGLL